MKRPLPDVSPKHLAYPSPVATMNQPGWVRIATTWAWITHHSLALVGLVLSVFTLGLLINHDLRQGVEQTMLQWLMVRNDVQWVDDTSLTPTPTVVANTTSSSLETIAIQASNGENEDPWLDATQLDDVKQLPSSQAAVALWLSKRYRVAPEPLKSLVVEAYAQGQRYRMEPTLILAVMAIESRFNPYAHSPVGAQGLMQVHTRVHVDKYQHFGGVQAAFDPISNLRVGVQILHDAIQRGGSIEMGLKYYLGAVSSDPGDYINKVLTEQSHLKRVEQGQAVPTFSSTPIPNKKPTTNPDTPKLEALPSLPSIPPNPPVAVPTPETMS